MTDFPLLHRRSDGDTNRLRRWLIALLLGIVLSFLVLLLCAALILHLPATALAPVVAAIAGGQVRLVLPAGEVGAGRGELWVRDATRSDWVPWMPIKWTLTPAWNAGRPALLVVSDVGSLRVDQAGLTVNRVRFGLPPELLLVALDHPLAKAPWRGDVELVAGELSCAWAGLQHAIPACDGQAVVYWRGMGSAILPVRELGSFVAGISAQSRDAGRWRADVSTDSGSSALVVAGFVEIANRTLKYDLTIGGDSVLTEGLGNVAGARLRHSDQAGGLILEGARKLR